MKQKTLVASLVVWSLMLSSSFASDYPVQPVDNGLAKKTINWIFTDPGLQKNTTEEARIIAAQDANKMSEIIVNSIKKLWLADDGFLTEAEMRQLNTYMYNNYHEEMVKLHGDDEWKLETGFHKVVNDGGEDKWYIPLKRHYKKANRIADGIFHLGLYPTVNNHKILNEDGNKNVRWRLISRGLYVLLKDDLNLKSWSKRAYYKPLIRQAKAEKASKVAELRKEGATKKEIRAVKDLYNAKIREYRKLMK